MKSFAWGNQLARCAGVFWLIAWQEGVAQPVAVDPPSAGNTNAHSMIVKVVDAFTTKPVGNTIILLPEYAMSYVNARTSQPSPVTDDSGVVTLAIPAAVINANHFSLTVSNANYPSRIASWYSQSGPVRASLPAEYTFKLEHGLTIGGFVRDERGQPMPGIKVVPWGNGAAAYNFNPSGSQSQVRDYGVLVRDDHRGVVTDAKGFWSYTNYPPDISRLTVDMVRPDGSRALFVTPNPDQRFGAEMGESVELEALRATNAVMVLKDGVTIRGVVVDESGKAIPNATVKERSGQAWNTPSSLITNDSQGRFAFPHRIGAQYLITAGADGYALSSVIATVAPEMEELKLVLPLAQPMRLRVLGEKDEPVIGAAVTVPEYRNRGHLLDWKGATDAEGRIVWSTAPRQTLSLAITPTNYPMRMARLESKAEEQVVRIRQAPANSIVVQLRVVDAESRQPVDAFAVWRDLEQNSAFQDSNWRGTNGMFKAELKRGEFRADRGSAYRLQARAEGYAPWVSDTLYFDEGDFEATVSIPPAKAPAGIVLLPDGQPAADAKVMLNAGQESIFMNSPENQYPRPGTITFKTGPDGAFKFDGAENEQRIVVIHRDGFASVTVEQIRQSGKIPLQKWGGIDGVLRAGGNPLARERINIKSPVSWTALESHHLVFSATTDADGRFVFTNLPPGDYVLYRQPHIIMGTASTESHRMVFDLGAGESKQIAYGFGGRTVVGHVAADSEIDWKNDVHLLSVKLPPAPPAPIFQAFVDSKAYDKARRAHGKSKAVLDYERQRQQFQLLFDKDGNFTIDDVPPGSYELSIAVTKPLKGAGRMRYERSQEIIGSIKREIMVPAGPAGSEFDLGTLEMEVKEGGGARMPPLDFTAETLDGKALNLASLRGKPLALIFWAQWAPYSPARLAELRDVFQALGANRGAAFVTVNLDENAGTARAGLAGLDEGWIHARLTGASRVDVTERLGVDTLPAILLLDAEGRVTARDPVGKRIRSSLERLVKQSAKK